jgi:hypothetical protein
MQEEVDELGDFKVIDCHCWLVFAGDDQAPLLRSFAKLDVPRRDAVDAAVGESCIN